MFKSLLRTIPSVSGNFTLACRLNDITKRTDKEYTAYINSAILLPLDNKIRLFKDININLINSKYEYDVQRYWKLLSDSFYTDTYSINKNIFDDYDLNPINLKDNRDKTFEFGCSRLPINYTGYQFRFYAPIYINDVNDLPDEFIIYIKNQSNQIIKKIRIPIAENINLNKLRIYLNKFLMKIQGNIPAYWNFKDNKIVYKNVIDCKNGGIINFTSYNVIKNNSSQVVINDFDNSISLAYSSNNIIMSEVIPLSFIFNIEDIFATEDLYYFHFNNFIISGVYVKNGIKQPFYDFDVNYHYKDIYFKNIDTDHSIYNIDSYNLFSNSISKSYQEGTEIKLYYENTLQYNYFRWKKFESEDYIINANGAYTSEYDRYGEFPILKNSINTIYAYITNDELSKIYNNLAIPINSYKKYFSSDQILMYEYICNNYYNDWFETYDENKLFDYNWSNVINNYVYHKGIYYKVNKDIDYFNIFIKPVYFEYDENRILANLCLEYENNSSVLSPNSVDNMTHVSSNKYLDIVYDVKDITEEDKLYIKYDSTAEYIKSSDADLLIKNTTNSYILLLFESITGYEKLTKINNSNILTNNETNILKSSTLLNNLYYSDVNSKVKESLKAYFNDINYDESIFRKSNFSYFIKDYFIYIYTLNEIIDKINYAIYDNNSDSLESRFRLLYPSYLNSIEEKINDAINVLQDNEYASFGDSYLNIKDSSINNDNDKTEIKLILEYLLFLLNYRNSIIRLTANVKKYCYTPYYNTSNINIDYDYFYAKGENNLTYDKIYIDSFNLSNYLGSYNIKLSTLKTNSETVYVNVDSKEIINAYFDELYNEESRILRNEYPFLDNLYHCQCFINDKFEIEYKLIKLIDYLNLFSDNFKFEIKTQTLINIFNNYSSFNNGLVTMSIPVNNGNFTITCNLYYKKKMYELNEKFYNTCLLNNIPLYLYKSSNAKTPISLIKNTNELYNKMEKVSTFKIVDSLSISPFIDSNSLFSQQILMKNIHKENDIYVYEDPSYIFKEVTLDEYMTEYSKTHQLYKYSKINSTNNNAEIEVIEHNGKKYGYIVLNYNFDLSSNSFNLYTTDNNDNFEIKYINGKEINDEYINVIFKFIYPYMKEDALISNYSSLKKYIILPENVTLKIDKQVVYYPSYTKLEKSQKNVNLYINRYFGNIDPLFIKVNNILSHQFSKLFKSSKNEKLNNEIPKYNNLIEENINIYQYNPITYISDKYNLDYICSKDYQLEYKHFNDNNLYMLPKELSFTHDDITCFDQKNIKDYANEEACFKYFKRYIKSKYYSKLSDTILLFLFKKYTISKYEESIVSYNLKINKKYCTVTYNLTLN